MLETYPSFVVAVPEVQKAEKHQVDLSTYLKHCNQNMKPKSLSTQSKWTKILINLIAELSKKKKR